MIKAQLEEGGHLSEKNIKRMDTIVQLADHMEELLQSLMTFSYTTQQTVNLAPHALFALVEEVIQIVLQAYPKETIRVDIKADLPEIHCDRAKVQSIYQNLIRNAIK